MVKAKGKDKHEYCWSCGKKTMQPKGDFSQCSSCGATYNDLPAPGRHTLKNVWADERGQPHWYPIGVAH